MNEYGGFLIEEIARLQREERLRMAEQYRLERIALAGRPRDPGLVGRFLYQLGRRMEAWGARLEARYRCAAELSPAMSGDCQ